MSSTPALSVARRALASTALACFGCGGAPLTASVCETPRTIEVLLESGPLLNPDAEGRPLPTEVRLYRLRDADVFETTAFDPIWQADAETLGGALLGVESLTLYPGESSVGSVVPESDARALVIMAIVRQPAGRTWRAIIDVGDLPCGARSHVRVRADEYRVERALFAPGED